MTPGRGKTWTAAVRVSGDSDGIARPSYNLALSRSRADAVKAAPQRRSSGTDVDIRSVGYGESRSVAPNKSGDKGSPDVRAENRHVEITFQSS
jgi:outer membrane protein OmpA-like peptidoglycan-associated protein